MHVITINGKRCYAIEEVWVALWKDVEKEREGINVIILQSQILSKN